MANSYQVTLDNDFICYKLNITDTTTYGTPPLNSLALAVFFNIDGGLYQGGFNLNHFINFSATPSNLSETSVVNWFMHWVVYWTAASYNTGDIVWYDAGGISKMWVALAPAVAGDVPGSAPSIWGEMNPNNSGKILFDAAGNLEHTENGTHTNSCTFPIYVEQECGCWRVDLDDYMTEESYQNPDSSWSNWNWAVAIINGSSITPIQFIDRNGGSPSDTEVEFCVPEAYNGQGTIRTIYTMEETLAACDFIDNENPHFEQQVSSACVNVTFDLESVGDCTSVVVTDTTDWGNSTLEREDVGIALFSSQDGVNWTGDLTNPGDNVTQGVWYLDAQNQNTIYITSFFVPVWSAGTYLAGAIVIHSGTFYFNGSGGSTTGVPGISPDWDILTVNDYGTFYNSIFNMGLDYWMYNTQITLDCDLTQIWKLSCYNYRIVPNLADITIEQGGVTYNRNWEISLFDYTGQELLGCWVIDRNAGETYADITTPSADGVYIVKIRYQAGTVDNSGCTNIEDDLEIMHTYPIYEICDLNNCYMSLVQSLLCNEIDPCCETCDEEVLRAMELQRLELNKMIALYFTLVSYLNIERVNYLGVNTFYDLSGNPVDMDRYNLVMQIKDIITKIGEVVGRCGDCNGTQEDTVSPCKDC